MQTIQSVPADIPDSNLDAFYEPPGRGELSAPYQHFTVMTAAVKDD